jgi:SAM-dependent methyltransferase
MTVIPNPPKDLEKYYENNSGSTMRSKPSVFTQFTRERLFGFEFNSILRDIKRDVKILDIGCGDGSLVKFLSKRFQTVSGADMYHEALWTGKNPYQQLKSPESLPSTDFCENVGLVFMRHVFEHVPSPQSYLLLLYELGVPDVVVVVPNRDSKYSKIFGTYWYYWDPPRHISHFSQQSLSKIGNEVGYSTKSSTTHGIDEIFVSVHTYLLTKEYFLMAKIFKPTGLLSSLMSIFTYLTGSGVIVHHFTNMQTND